MQQIIGGMQNDYKSTVATFPSHEVELGEIRVIHRLQGVMYPGQPQPPLQIGGKTTDLRTTGPSGLGSVGPVFRSELPRHAPEPPRTA
jgi:hypothetical protein